MNALSEGAQALHVWKFCVIEDDAVIVTGLSLFQGLIAECGQHNYYLCAHISPPKSVHTAVELRDGCKNGPTVYFPILDMPE